MENITGKCLAGRSCGDTDKCERCGWNEDEDARRRELLRTEGLRKIKGTGLMGLVLVRETKGAETTT